MTSYISKDIYGAKPFFMYTALNSPNSNPIKPDNPYRSKYENTYKEGYIKLSEKRFYRMKQRHKKLTPDRLFLDKEIPNWSSLSEREKREQIANMIHYASSVDQLDHSLGKLMNYLDDLNELDNTILILVSSKGQDDDEPRKKINHWNQMTDFKKTQRGHHYEGSLRSSAVVYYPKKSGQVAPFFPQPV